jgi:hypothetical protein
MRMTDGLRAIDSTSVERHRPGRRNTEQTTRTQAQARLALLLSGLSVLAPRASPVMSSTPRLQRE